MTKPTRPTITSYGMFSICVRDGNVIREYKHGSTEWSKEEIRYDNGKPKQITKFFSFSKRLSGFEVTKNGIKYWKGYTVTKYYENGKTQSTETFCEDKLCGHQFYYRESGRLESVLFYLHQGENDVNYCNKIKSLGLHGMQKYYYDSGRLEREECFSFGDKNGWSNYYDTKGNCTKSEIYRAGSLTNTISAN